MEDVTITSDAEYAGQSAKDASGNIQLRSKNSNSGLVSTTSGGTIKSVKITVGSGSNTIDVYGKNTAYTDATDLYSSSTQGTKVGYLTSTGTITFMFALRRGSSASALQTLRDRDCKIGRAHV